MNQVNLIGRLTKDPEVRFSNSGTCFANFSLAIDRPSKNGEKTTDFPKVMCIGKTAESAEKYLYKGRLIAVTGSIQTGSYEDRNGNKVYTTDVLANRIEYLSWERENQTEDARKAEFFKPVNKEPKQITMGFEQIDDGEVPF